MINKRLIKLVPESIPHVVKNVLLQICSLTSTIVLIFTMAQALSRLLAKAVTKTDFLSYFAILGVCMVVRVICTFFANRESYNASKSIKSVLRTKIYNKIIRLGTAYNKKISTAEVLHISLEGVEQLETYFGNYLPQFFYSMFAPLVLFFLVATINIKIAIMLFVCVPLIPLSIIAIQKIAKKILSKY